MEKCRLSVNLNKIALIRNARGEDFPNLVSFAMEAEDFGAQGITVHPRPDERHVKFSDLPALKEVVRTEFNVEGYPSDRFMKEVLLVKPHQVTLVPDPPKALTSTGGWNTVNQKEFLKSIIAQLQAEGIRVSLFLDPKPEMVDGAAEVGADRVELYTGAYARAYPTDATTAIVPHRQSARRAQQLGLGLNAGHDLNLRNLHFYKQHLSNLIEVSIGQALVVDALHYGFQNAIQMYLQELRM